MSIDTIEEYIGGFPSEVQKVLHQMRSIIRKAAPEAEERISYGMPTFTLNGNLVHYAAFKNHIGLFALPSVNGAIAERISEYKMGKGSIQFPLNKPLPSDLIIDLVKCRISENQEKVNKKNQLGR